MPRGEVVLSKQGHYTPASVQGRANLRASVRTRAFRKPITHRTFVARSPISGQEFAGVFPRGAK